MSSTDRRNFLKTAALGAAATWIQPELGALYALPSGVAGFHAVKGLSETGGAGETWTLIFASIGAIIVGATAWVRIASLAGPETQSGGVNSHHA